VVGNKVSSSSGFKRAFFKPFRQGRTAYVKNPANAPHAGALEAGIEYPLLFGLAMLGLSGINDTPATTSFADVLLFAASGMAVFYQINASTSLTSVGGCFFYHVMYYLLSL